MFSSKVPQLFWLVLTIEAVLRSADQANQYSEQGSFQNGDIILGGLFPIHVSTSDGRCGKLRSRDVVRFVQAMICAIDEVNSKSYLLPGVSLGFNIFDYCSKDVIALEKSATFLNTCSAYNKTRSSPVVGVVGPYASSVTLQVSNLLGLFKIPHISYGATSPLLSDKGRFKYFLRTVPSDKIRALAIAETLQESGTTYVSLVYSDDDFGRGGANSFFPEAKERGICIAVSRAIQGLSPNEINETVRELAGRKEASVVILFCAKRQIGELLSTAKELGHQETFFWLIGGDLSETRTYLDGNEEMANKVIIFAPKTSVEPGIGDWRSQLNDSRNPWIKETMESVMDTHEDVGLMGNSGGLFLTAPHVQNVITAVYTFAHALDKMVRTVCRNASFTRVTCIQEEASEGRQLLHFMKTTRFESRGRKIRFENTGDICAEYDMLRPTKLNCSDRWGFSIVGEWTSISRHGRKIQRIFPKSSCTLQCGAGEIKRSYGLHDCCWRCIPCGENEIADKDNIVCKPCPDGSKVDANRTGCQSLVTLYNDPDPAFVTVTVCGAVVCLLCSLVVLAVFVFHKDNPVIKASSRGLSCVLLVGVVLSCSGSLLEVLEPDSLICTLKRYAALGYVMCYDVMFCTALRFNRLFNSSLRSRMHPTLVSTRSQLMLAGVIWGLAALIYTAWGFYSFQDSVIAIYTDEAVVIQCKVLNLEYAMRVSIDLTLLCLCAFYTFKTRKVPKQFRQSREMGIAIQGTATIKLITLATTYSLEIDHVIRGRVAFSTKPVFALLVLVPIFVPKMYGVLRHRGEKSATFRANDRFENLFGGRGTETPEVVRNAGDLNQVKAWHTNSTGGSCESLHRRVVHSTEIISHTALRNDLRCSAEVPGLQSALDPVCTAYSPRADATCSLENGAPFSKDSVYSTWL